MSNALKTGLALLFILIAVKGRSQLQQTDPQQLVADIVEELSSKSENDLDFTPIIEDLMNMVENPLKINSCTIDDLSRLVFLSDFQIQSLWDYIQSNGSILSIYEIPLVPGFDQSDAHKMIPFIDMSKPSDIEKTKNIFWKGHHDLTLKAGTVFEKAAGYYSYPDPSKSRYLGDRYSLYTRYTYQSTDKVEWGFIADKDPGEEIFKGSNASGFDYLAGYLSLSNIGKVKKVVIGDFDAGFGQGLTFWSSLSPGKSSDPMGIRKRARGLVKHSSTNENKFLRGAGITISPIKNIELTAFGSYKKVDANTEDSTIDGDILFTSLPESGLHRTNTEIDNKDALREIIAGGNIHYNRKNIKGGITFSYVAIDGHFAIDSTPYKLYDAPVTGRSNIGVDLEGYLKGHHLFGEAAIAPNSSEYAVLAGGLFRLSPLVNFSILARSYAKGYTNIYTSAFAEGSGSYNENGIFSGISVLLAKGWKASAYIDLFKYPWLKYRVNSPSSGYEYQVQIEYQLSSTFTTEVRYRLKKTDQNFASEFSKTAIVLPQTNQSARLQLTYTLEPKLMLRSRIDFSSFSNDSTSREYGYMLSQDIGYTSTKLPFSISVRFAIFNTDSWNARIYAYENDLLYSFSVPAFYSKGTRTYILLKYSPSKRIDCWLRWSQTYYSDMSEIGQGLDLINGNTKNDTRLMVRVRF